MSEWKLGFPPSLTEEEKELRSKYDTLRNLKLKLDFLQNYENKNRLNSLDCSKTEASQFQLKKAALKVLESSGAVLREEISKDRKTSGFKRSVKQNEGCQAKQKKNVMTEFAPETDLLPRSVTIRGPNLNHELVLETFRKFGDIIKISMGCDNESAVVTYKNPEDARMASVAINAKESTEFSVKLAKQRNFSWMDISMKEAIEYDASTVMRGINTVHISYEGNLTAVDLRYVFRSAGSIEKIYISPKKQFAFVTFQFESEAKRAVDEVNGKVYNGAALTVSLHRKSIKKDFSFPSDVIPDEDSRELITYDALET